MRSVFLPFAVTATLVCAVASAAPIRGTVVLRNGRTFENVLYEVRGQGVWVQFEWGEITYPLSSVEKLVPDRAGGGEQEAEEGEDAGPTATDWETRFTLEPPDGWEVVEARRPLVRAALRHGTLDATLTVTVRPADGPDWQISDDPRFRPPREVAEAIAADLETMYGRIQRPRVDVSTFRRRLVYRLNEVVVAELGAPRNETRSLTEVRFRQFGFEYAVSLSVARDDEAALKGQVEEILGAFSFLPPVSVSEDAYSDFERGFALRRPNADWALRAQPFNPANPLLLVTGEGRGEVSVRVVANTNPDAVVQGVLRPRRASRHYSGETVSQDRQGGSPVVRFAFDDFKEGGRVKLRHEGFAASLRGNVLLFMGISPLTDQDARKIQQEVGEVLSSVRLQDLDRLTNETQRQRGALAAVSEGLEAHGRRRFAEAIQRYDAAIQASAGFAIAYYLRGQSKRELQDFDGYRQDLEQADELDPGASYSKELAQSYEYEAQAAQRARDFSTALDLWVRCYRSSGDARQVRHIATCATSLWNDAKREKEYQQGARALESRLRLLRNDPAIVEILGKIFTEGATLYSRENRYPLARTMARDAKRLARYVRDDKLDQQADRLLEQIRTAEQRHRDKR